jgi:uncharacterized damage-inducible protein DinB
MPVFFSFAQVREDLNKHTQDISPSQLWQPMAGMNSLGFHLKHIAGSVDRLTTYLAGHQLTADQLTFLNSEIAADDSLHHLLALIDERLQATETLLLEIDANTLYEPRAVGRHSLPTTVLGLLVHLAEHTQRHLGQAVLLTRLLRQA